MAIHFYLIRHGKTEWNIAGLLQGSRNSALVEEGILGAKITGEALKEVVFSACYSSCQQRAQETADYIIGERQIAHFHHRGLNEFDFGKWEGRKSVELADHPEYQLLRTQPELYQATESEGELVEALYQRVNRAFWDIVARHQDGDNVLIVSHGMTLTMLTALLKGLPWQSFRDLGQHAFVMNTAINVARVENGRAELIRFNDVAHLNAL